MAAHARLKIEFTKGDKCHNLMSQLRSFYNAMPQNSCFVMELHKYGVYLSDKLKCTTTDQMERPLFNFDLPQHDITRQCGIIGQYDQTFDLKVNVSHCDLCFMIQ